MTFGVRWLLRRMDICPNAYYNYRKDRKAGYRERKEQLKDKILKIFHEYSGNPGYRMMRVYLLRAKISLSHATILKYMQELGIQSTVKPKKPAYKKGDCYKKFVNHLNREFHAKNQMRNGVRMLPIFLWKMGESVITAVLLTCMIDL